MTSGEPGGDLIDLAEAVALLKTTRPTFYRWLRSGRIRGRKVGRQWRFARADVERFLAGEQPRVEVAADVAPLLAELGSQLAAFPGAAPDPAEDPVSHAVALMIALALRCRASDIHLDPIQEGGAPRARGSLRYRIDGVLHRRAEFDLRLLPGLIQRWKTLATCDVHDRTRPQAGQVRAAPWGSSAGEIPLRVTFLPAFQGESMTARIVSQAESHQTPDELGLAPADLATFRRQIAAAYGLIVVTGPVGCGKTTTLYAALRELARPELKVVSLEDPVEAVVPGVVQHPVNPEANLTFAAGLRAIFRSDPDIVMVGEIRDRETLRLAQQLAMTGHLVLTALHTQDAAGALVRMSDVGADPFHSADATRAVLAQRLVRRLCPDCSVPEEPDQALLAEVRRRWPFPSRDDSPHGCRRPRGCPACGGTGHHGRLLLSEVLVMSPALRSALMAGAGAADLRSTAIAEGMTPIVAHGLERAAAGEVSLREVLASAPDTP